MSGKGSKPRPIEIDRNEYEKRWDEIFKKRPSDYQDNLSTDDSVLDALEHSSELEKQTQDK